MTEYERNDWLTDYRKGFYSQSGEEGVLDKVFEVLNIKDDKWCVEFGASNGTQDSNSRRLINDFGWFAVLIEADKGSFGSLQKIYHNNEGVVCINRMVCTEGKDTLDKILEKTPIPLDFGFLSIDIDGNDYHVWQAVKVYSPKVVMIEFNPKIPCDLEFVQPVGLGVNVGSSLLSLVKLAKIKGYELVHAFNTNAIFVKSELFQLFNIEDNSYVKMYHSLRTPGNFFESYDGSIILYNCDRKKLLALRKKVLSNAVWVYEQGELCPVNFVYEYKIFRFIKNLIKKSAVYHLIYPVVKRFYGYVDAKKKQKIN